MIPLNSHGEIVDIQEADQFQPAKSQFECGYFACAMARSMAQPGQPPTLSMSQVIADAEQWYAQYDGTDAITNTNGMTLEQEYELLTQIGLHYQATSTDIAIVKQWIVARYPVIIAIVESSVRDLALGDTNPYPWTPAGTHIIVVTGVTSDGTILVRDSANCTSLYDPNSLRPGPRTYDASALQLVSATVAVPPWMPRPISATPPAGEPSMLDITATSYFKDLGNHVWLCGPTNVQIGHAILDFYRATGQPPYFGLTLFGLPRTNEIPVAGSPGVVLQVCERAILCYDPVHVIDSPPGSGPVYPLHLESGPGLLQLQSMLPGLQASNVADAIALVSQLKVTADAALAKVLADLQPAR